MKTLKLKLYRFLGVESCAHARARVRRNINAYANAAIGLNWRYEGDK